MYLTATIKTDRSDYATKLITQKEVKMVNRQKVLVPPQGTIKMAKDYCRHVDGPQSCPSTIERGSRQLGTVSKFDNFVVSLDDHNTDDICYQL
ncbi:unnamed protein product [Phytophthora lilii]|uniref:Unnamed protein product n=1 Tax=Phytophthora lilii TaxID=2077276 RepID=A0A9W6X3Q4_9STRA|nr:unnamed protein product [Phytophthora lilii]